MRPKLIALSIFAAALLVAAPIVIVFAPLLVADRAPAFRDAAHFYHPLLKWTTQQWQYFLAELPPTLSADRIAALDEQFGLGEFRNSEVLFDWLRIAIRHHYEPAKRHRG